MIQKDDKPVAQDRSTKVGFDLYDSKEAIDLYVDGISEALLGPFVSKLTFHLVDRVVPDGNEKILERRETKLKLTVPTASLIDFIEVTTRGLSDSLELFDKAGNELSKKRRSLIEARRK